MTSTSLPDSPDSPEELRERWMLSADLAAAETPLERSQASLSAAQRILARECVPLLTALLIAADPPRPVSTCSSRLVTYTDVATGLLDDAASELEAAHELEARPEADVLWQTRDRVAMLRAFAGMFAALGKADGSSASQEALLDACNELALYQHDDNRGIAESVRFWRAVAYRHANRPERALQLLHPILAAPAPRRLGYWARLERCRSLCDADRHAAGIALCLRIEARVPTWFDGVSEETCKKAADTAKFIHIELLQSWESALRDAGQDDRAEHAATEAVKLRGSDSYPPTPDRWLGLEESIAGLPDDAPDAVDPAPDSDAD
ncbi:MAG: hypothetical protein ABII12_01995 [Planctomycetota bacterium]